MQILIANSKFKNAITYAFKAMLKNSENHKGFKMVKKILIAFAIISGILVQLNAYNGQAAARFAIKWTKKDLSDTHKNTYKYYPNLDCTNFMSQCLEAGGIRYDRIGYNPYQQWWSNWNKEPSESWRRASIARKRAYWGGYDNAVRIWRKKDMKIGDIVFFDWYDGSSTDFDHSTIVTKIKDGLFGRKIYLTYHSNHRVNRDFDIVNNDARRWECYRPGGL